jgi:hypothetical protein
MVQLCFDVGVSLSFSLVFASFPLAREFHHGARQQTSMARSHLRLELEKAYLRGISHHFLRNRDAW